MRKQKRFTDILMMIIISERVNVLITNYFISENDTLVKTDSFEIPKECYLYNSTQIDDIVYGNSGLSSSLIKYNKGYILIYYYRMPATGEFYVKAVHYFNQYGDCADSKTINASISIDNFSYFIPLSFNCGNFYRISCRKDYLKFVEHCKIDFKGIEDWEECFGFTLPSDDDGNITQSFIEYAKINTLSNEPKSYPCTIFYLNDKGWDRFGDNTIQIFDYVEDSEWSK